MPYNCSDAKSKKLEKKIISAITTILHFQLPPYTLKKKIVIMIELCSFKYKVAIPESYTFKMSVFFSLKI